MTSTPLARQPRPTTQQVSAAIAALMPHVVRGIQLDFFLKKGVTQTQFLLVMAVHASGGCSMTALATSLHVALPTATGIVGRLVRAGYLQRRSHSADRRQVLVGLTGKGERFIRDFQAVSRKRWEDVLGALHPGELAAFHRVVMALLRRLEASGS